MSLGYSKQPNIVPNFGLMTQSMSARRAGFVWPRVRMRLKYEALQRCNVRISALVSFLIKSVIVGLAAAFVVLWLRPGLLPLQGRAAVETPANGLYGPASYAEAVNKAAPAVVSVYTRTLVTEPLGGDFTDPLLRGLFGDRMVRRPYSGLGSGVIASEDGYVLTNLHVIEGVDNIRVALFDGRIAEAEIVGTDTATDLAVLKIGLDDLPVAQLVVENRLRTGDVVLAIGNALGLNHTVTMGIVSATGRGEIGAFGQDELIQTDAAINPGNSGGALINPDGGVVGINRLSRRVGEGISFAVPADLAGFVLNQIIENGTVRRAWLGANLADMPVGMGATGQGVHGVQITEIYHGGPAWRAGLRLGDILTHANGEPLLGARQLLRDVAQGEPGDTIELEAIRNGQAYIADVTLIEQPRLRS